MMTLDALTMVVVMRCLSVLSGAEAGPCPAATTSMNVTTIAALPNMINIINCNGEGTFGPTWTGRVQLAHIIELSDYKTLTVTGSRPILKTFPSDVIYAGSTTSIFAASNGSTLTLKNLVLQGGASKNGAAVDAGSFSSVDVVGCASTNNNATTGGGTRSFVNR